MPSSSTRFHSSAPRLLWAGSLESDERVGRFRTSSGTAGRDYSARITVPGGSGEAPDAWKLLQTAGPQPGRSQSDGGTERVANSLPGVGLEHLLTSGPGHWSPKPGHWSPKPGHWSAQTRLTATAPWAVDGRLPMAYTGPRPQRRTTSEWEELASGDRPVVAVLDTGCGDHPWFDYIDERWHSCR